jgi:hypothetical protein
LKPAPAGRRGQQTYGLLQRLGERFRGELRYDAKTGIANANYRLGRRAGNLALVEPPGGRGKYLLAVGVAHDLRRYPALKRLSSGGDSRRQIPIRCTRVRLRLLPLESAFGALELDLGNA